MLPRRLKQPLDPRAVKAANEALKAETGGRALTMEPQDAALRAKWTDAYVAAGGGVEGHASTSSPPGSPTSTCPTCIKVEFVPKPSSPLPGAQSERAGERHYPTKFFLPEVEHTVDLDKGSSVEKRDITISQVPSLFTMPKFPIGERATNLTGIHPTPIMALETGKTHIFDIINEVPVVAAHMANEMNVNSTSDEVKEIQALNDVANAWYAKSVWYRFNNSGSSEAMKAVSSFLEAKEKFKNIVQDGAKWDHKTYLRQHWGSWHTWGRWEYYYDVWSNIHYGYVGRAAGFSVDVLLESASLANMLDSIKGLRMPSPDTSSDVVAIKKGCELYDKKTNVTVDTLIKILEDTPEFVRRSRSFNSYDNGNASIVRRNP